MTTSLRQRMLQDLQIAGLSERTQEAYLRVVRQLADHFHTPPDQLSEQQVRDYFLHLKNDRRFASASLGIAYSGIKFFYSHTVARDWPTLRRLRVRREKRLPDVLSVDEVRQLIAAVRTPHNRTYYWGTHRHPTWLFPATGRDHRQTALAAGAVERPGSLAPRGGRAQVPQGDLNPYAAP